MTPLRRMLGAALVGFALCLSYGGAAHAQSVSVLVNGQPLVLDQAPVIQGGHVLVPLRGIFERLGATVVFNAADRSIRATQGSTSIGLTIGSSSASVNGRAVTLETPATEVGGRTLVPLRFVSEALGANVTWNAATRTVDIASSGATPPSTTYGPPPTTTTAPPAAAAPTINNIVHNGLQPLSPGQTLNVVMTGTAGGTATFDLLGISNGNYMQETSPGRYEGSVTISDAMSVYGRRLRAPVVAHLSLGGQQAMLQATHPITIAASGTTYPDAYGTTGIRYVSFTPNSAYLQPGQTITVHMDGVSGGMATMNIGPHQGIPMSEVSTGNYVGTWQLQVGDIGSQVIALLRLPNGTTSQLAAPNLIGQLAPGIPGAPGSLFVTVQSPTAGQQVGGDFTVTGMTQPYATVEVRASVQRPLIPGVIGYNAGVVTTEAQADANGNYAVPVHVGRVPKNSSIDLHVQASDAYGHTSQPVEFNIATGF